MTNTGGGSAGYKIEPQAIPSLRKAFQDASAQLDKAISSIRSAQMSTPAMTDDASTQFQQAFNSSVQQQAGSLTEFKQRLDAVFKTLGDIQRAYDNNDQEIARNLTSQLES